MNNHIITYAFLAIGDITRLAQVLERVLELVREQTFALELGTVPDLVQVQRSVLILLVLALLESDQPEAARPEPQLLLPEQALERSAQAVLLPVLALVRLGLDLALALDL
jgi:hypothetical protein